MRRNNELEARLIEWADEYAGSRYADIGYPSRSWLYNAMLYQGPSPQGLNPRRIETNTPADKVEQAVMRLQKQDGGYRAAQVIRAEYWMKSAAEKHKLDALAKMGGSMGRHTYYRLLHVARVHVAACIGVPFSDSTESIAC